MEIRIASVQDRLLAFLIDVFLFLPIVSFLLAQVYQRTEFLFKTSPNSLEFLVFLAVALLFTLILAVLIQSLILMLFGRTPGQFFLRLKIVGIQYPEQKPSSSQILLRSFLMTWQCVLVFPWLEVLSHHQRRALHDRAAETIVSTLKVVRDPGPHPLEIAVVKQLNLAVIVFMSFCGIAIVGYLYRMALQGEFKREELTQSGYLCESVPEGNQAMGGRIGEALALYLAQELAQDCLQSEIDFVFWKKSNLEEPWAYLAKSFLLGRDRDLRDQYLERACASAEESRVEGLQAEICGISQLVKGEKDVKMDFSSLIGKVVQAEFLFNENKWSEAETHLDELMVHPGMQSFSIEKMVKIEWSKGHREKSLGMLTAAYSFSNHEYRDDMAAWLCHEQLDDGCQSKQNSCDLLIKPYERRSGLETRSLVVGLALLRLQQCRPDFELSPQSLSGLRNERASFAKIELLMSKASSEKSTSENRREFLNLVKSAEKSPYLRYFASKAWIGYADRSKDIEDFISGNQWTDKKSYLFYKLVRIANQKLALLGDAKASKRLEVYLTKDFIDHENFRQPASLDSRDRR